MRWVVLSLLLMTRVAAAQTLDAHVDPDRPEVIGKAAELADAQREARARAVRLRSSILTEAGLVAGSALVGTLGASAVHGDARAGYVMLGSTLGAFLPALLIDDLLPGPWNDDLNGVTGVARFYTGALIYAHWAGFAGSAVGAFLLADAGAYAGGRLGERTPPSHDASTGAAVGAAVGVAGSIALTSWLHERWPERRWLRIAVGSTVIGASASLGYQLAR